MKRKTQISPTADVDLSAPRGVEPRYRDYETRLDRRSDITRRGKE